MTKFKIYGFLIMLALRFNLFGAASAQEADRPTFSLLRYEDKRLNESGEFLQSSEKSASIGGEIRQRLEYIRDVSNSDDKERGDTTLLQRYNVHANLRLNPSLQVFGQLASTFEHGREGGPTPIDANQLEFQNLFIKTAYKPNERTRVSLSAGRQELNYGSARLVSVREGPNVRRTFSTARLSYERDQFKVDSFAARPRQLLSGSFDDSSNDDIALWGIYTSYQGDQLIVGNLDVYYLGYQNDAAVFGQSKAKEKRHSLGVRAFGSNNNWDWNWELIAQLGEFGQDDIRSWTVATETAYSWPTIKFKPRLALSSNIASGDAQPNDHRLGTFNPLFPRGNYFSEAAVLGPQNFFNLHPMVSIAVSDRWTISTDLNFFWRKETEDGVYTPSGRLLSAANSSDERFVASTFSISSAYQINNHVDISAVYGRFSPRRFLQQINTDFSKQVLELSIRFRF